MKKDLKKIFRKGFFVMIGGKDIEFPIGEKWGGLDEVIFDIKDIINIAIALSSVAAVAMIIVSGYTLITASGNPDKIEQGQKSLTAAIIGLVLVLIAGLVVRFVLKTFDAI